MGKLTEFTAAFTITATPSATEQDCYKNSGIT